MRISDDDGGLLAYCESPRLFIDSCSTHVRPLSDMARVGPSFNEGTFAHKKCDIISRLHVCFICKVIFIVIFLLSISFCEGKGLVGSQYFVVFCSKFLPLAFVLSQPLDRLSSSNTRVIIL